MAYNDSIPESGLEVNEVRHIQDFVFSFTYLPVLKQIIGERRPAQIARSLGISDQCLNNRLQKLEKCGAAVRGDRTTYREWSVPNWVQEKLKHRNGELKRRRGIPICLCVHCISAAFRIIKDSKIEIGEKVKRLRSEQWIYWVPHKLGLFRVVRTLKNIIVHFPKGYRMTYSDVDGTHVLDLASEGIYYFAEEIMSEVKKKCPDLEVGRSHKSAHYAFKDKIAKTLTHKGITMTIKRETRRAGIDKSPHFSPTGEFEAYDEKTAYEYITFMLNLPKYIPVLEKLAKYMEEGKDLTHIFEQATKEESGK